jgi:hypothetical protein
VEIEDADGKSITSATGKKRFEAPWAIVRVHFEGMDEMKIKVRVKKFCKRRRACSKRRSYYYSRRFGREIKAKYEGTVNC